MVARDRWPSMVASDRWPYMVARDRWPSMVASDRWPSMVASDRWPSMVYVSGLSTKRITLSAVNGAASDCIQVYCLLRCPPGQYCTWGLCNS